MATPQQKKRRGRYGVLGLILAAMMAFAAVAFADVVKNDVAISGVGGSKTILQGQSATINYYVQATGGTCDPADGSAATLTINKPADVSATPATVSITGCDNTGTGALEGSKAVTFSAAPGTYDIPAVSVADTNGSYNAAGTAFKLIVQADGDGDGLADVDDNCPAVANANQADADADGQGDVCDADKDGDGVANTSDNCPADANANQLDSDGDGIGNACDSTPFPLDSTPPVITPNVQGTTGNNGWYTSNVTVSWSVSDPDSTISSQSGCGTTIISADTAGTTLTCTATSAGGTNQQSVTIKRDASAPNVQCPAGPSGWQANNVSLSCSANDVGPSGLANSGDASFTLSTNVAAGTADATASTGSRTVSDDAGNSTAAGPFGPFMVDRALPNSTADAGTYASGTWTNNSVSVQLNATDAGSGVDHISYSINGGASQSVAPGATLPSFATDGTYTISYHAVDNVGNTEAANSFVVRVDKTPPDVNCGSADNLWHATDVTISCSASDSGSGLAGSSTFSLSTNVADGTEDSNASTGTRLVSDNAGNTATAGPISGIKVDKKAPTGISWNGGIAAGGSYYFGFVPAAPTCSATDGGSGLAGCDVTGYSADVGQHTMTATATDNVGNESTATRSYTVLAWTLRGFYQPVDMGADVLNAIKGGSTVPLKFEIFAGSTELTATSAVDSLVMKQIPCQSGDAVDDVEITATGGTSLRYDATAGQFIYNWQTPKKPGTCMLITMTTDDGSSLSAQFKLR